MPDTVGERKFVGVHHVTTSTRATVSRVGRGNVASRGNVTHVAALACLGIIGYTLKFLYIGITGWKACLTQTSGLFRRLA